MRGNKRPPDAAFQDAPGGPPSDDVGTNRRNGFTGVQSMDRVLQVVQPARRFMDADRDACQCDAGPLLPEGQDSNRWRFHTDRRQGTQALDANSLGA